MRTKHLIVGTACGLALGAGVIAAVDAGTQTADAQGDFKVTPAQLQINQKISQAAVRRSNQGLNYLAPIRTGQSDAADTGRNGVTPLANVPGSGQGWTSSQIGNAAITGSKIANEAVNSEKIAPGGVTSGDLADNSVTGSKIDAGAVTEAKIATGAVTGQKIASGAVGTGELGAGAVTREKLAPGQRQYWAAVTGGIPPVVTAQSDPTGGITAIRINAGNYRVDVGTDVSGCAYSATPAFDVGGAAAISAQASPDTTDANRVAIRTVTAANAAVDANFHVQVLC